MIKTLRKGAWKLELDSSEIFPKDPGNGTPAMVYGPKDSSATYFCAVGCGYTDSRTAGDVEIPQTVMEWLEAQEDMVEKFIEENAPKS